MIVTGACADEAPFIAGDGTSSSGGETSGFEDGAVQFDELAVADPRTERVFLVPGNAVAELEGESVVESDHGHVNRCDCNGPGCPVVISPGSVVSRPRPRPPRR